MNHKIIEEFESAFNFDELDERQQVIAYAGSYAAFEMGWLAAEEYYKISTGD